MFFAMPKTTPPGWPVVDADKIAHELLADKEGRDSGREKSKLKLGA